MLLTTLAVAWVAGLLAGRAINVPVDVLALWGVGVVALGAASAIARTKQRRLLLLGCIALAVMLVGMAWGDHSSDTAVDADLAPLFSGDAVTLRGQVISDPERIGSLYRFRLGNLAVAPEVGGNEWQQIIGTILVTADPTSTLSKERTAPHFHYGDTLELKGEVEAPPVLEGFDYRDYLAQQGIGAVMSFPTSTKLLGSGEGSWLREQVYALRSKLSASLDRSLPEPQAALAQSLLLGKRRDLPPDVRQSFIETGTSHLLAISGLHIAVMLGAMLAFGRLLFGGRRWAFVLALGGIWLYALVSGMSPSVTRAVIMGSIYLFGRIMGREGASLPALATAAAVMAGLNPKLLGNISFQLSFTAVTALLLLAPPLERRFTAVVERFTGTEGPASTFGRAVAVALAAGVAATIGTLPLVALAFERVSYLGVPVTLLALPALPLALIGGATTAIAGLVWEPLGIVAGWATWVPLAYLLELAGVFARAFGGSFSIGGVTPTIVWAYYAVAVALLLGGRRFAAEWVIPVATNITRGRPTFTVPCFRLVALALVIASAVLWTAAMTSPDGRLTVIFLDVGQGDAIFIRTPNGQQVLVDGGPDPRVTLGALGDAMPFWDRSLDAVILTHPHADHLNGLVRVLERYDVDLVGEAKLVSGQSQYVAWRKLITANVDTRIVMSEGQELRTGDGVIITVLNPPPDLSVWSPDIINNGSVVLRVTFGTVSFLLTGDIEQEAEAALLARGVPVRSTVYKAPHHGSKTSTSAMFLEAVDPTVAVISVGRINSFKHPDGAVVARLEEALGNENVLLTSQHGDVHFTTDGVRLWLDADR